MWSVLRIFLTESGRSKWLHLSWTKSFLSSRNIQSMAFGLPAEQRWTIQSRFLSCHWTAHTMEYSADRLGNTSIHSFLFRAVQSWNEESYVITIGLDGFILVRKIHTHDSPVLPCSALPVFHSFLHFKISPFSPTIPFLTPQTLHWTNVINKILTIRSASCTVL